MIIFGILASIDLSDSVIQNCNMLCVQWQYDHRPLPSPLLSVLSSWIDYRPISFHMRLEINYYRIYKPADVYFWPTNGLVLEYNNVCVVLARTFVCV